jgi:hypothetical protein
VADNVLRQAVQAITDVITRHGLINVDFADVRSIMAGAGEALMGMGEARGSGRALDAAKTAIQSPLLENVTIDGAKGLLVNISGNKSITLVRSQDGHGFHQERRQFRRPRFLRAGVRRRVGRSVYGDRDRHGVSPGAARNVRPPLGRGPCPPPASAGCSGRGAFCDPCSSPIERVPVEMPVGDDDLRRPAYLRRKARKLG